MTELVEQLFLAAVQQHYDRELARMILEAEYRAVERVALQARANAYAAGHELTAQATHRQRENALRYVAPLLDEHRLRGALDGYEQAVRPPCTCCTCPRHSDREVAMREGAN